MRLPADKHDQRAVEEFRTATPDEIAPYLAGLLEWIQDLNWPVARGIVEVLSRSDSRIVPHLKSILRGDDEVWKYSVLSSLALEVAPEVREELMDDVVRIINMPTEGEKTEDLPAVARDVLIKNSFEQR